MLRYLIVEDEPDVASVLMEVVEGAGSRPLHAPDGRSALWFVESYGIDIALVDIMLPDISGLELIRLINEKSPDTVIIVITSVYEPQTIVKAVKQGASEYITKPFEIAYLKRVLSTYEELIRHRKRSPEPESAEKDPIGEIIGESPVIRALKKTVREVASTDSTILLTGPTGVGKGVFARVIHKLSPRRDAQFVKLDCGAIPEALLESEIFGYNKGAFTGADRDKKGLVERADGGTLFMDEIGELPLNLQTKFLGFLDTKEFRRIGGARDRRSDARIIAATNRSLEEMVKKGTFREDLFYRLNVIHLHIPPLRERGGDVMQLAEYFLGEFSRKMSREIKGFTPDAREFIMNYHWPGNIRELMNLIERAVALTEGDVINLRDLSVPLKPERDLRHFPKEIIPLRRLEDDYILYVLKSTGGNKSLASRLLGITRKTLRDRLRAIEDAQPHGE
ncbi:MAG: sigma-54-dependent Fis family transcriptional regulator [Nitrospirae bacterium]|nr:MAG: sigma-54-dependent Fis family transcriptional regulator [Nitrospirota bacterium]